MIEQALEVARQAEPDVSRTTLIGRLLYEYIGNAHRRGRTGLGREAGQVRARAAALTRHKRDEMMRVMGLGFDALLCELEAMGHGEDPPDPAE